jgi:hypothetical protein
LHVEVKRSSEAVHGRWQKNYTVDVTWWFGKVLKLELFVFTS